MNKVSIEIGVLDGACFYELQDADGSALLRQDSLFVKPNARVTLNPQVAARVTFTNNGDVSAVEVGEQKVRNLSAGQDPVDVKVRKSKSVGGAKASTKHAIQIFCTSIAEDGETMLDSASEKPSSMGVNEGGNADGFLSESDRGPSSSAEWIPAVRMFKGERLGDGGPGMEVEDP